MLLGDGPADLPLSDRARLLPFRSPKYALFRYPDIILPVLICSIGLSLT